MVESGNNSTKGLIIVSKLYQEGKIDDDQREQLKGNPHPYAIFSSRNDFL
jgi:hypothetical protein